MTNMLKKIMADLFYIKSDFKIDTHRLHSEYYWNKHIYLHIEKPIYANTKDGKKFVYEVYPIKDAEPVPKFSYTCTHIDGNEYTTHAINEGEAITNANFQICEETGRFIYINDEDWSVVKNSDEIVGWKHEPKPEKIIRSRYDVIW